MEYKPSDKINAEDKLSINIFSGLERSEVIFSRKKYGSNTLTKTKRKSFISKFISNLGDPIIKILIGAMIINAAFMMKNINWPEMIGIACAVLTATLVSTISEHGSEKAFDKLNEAVGNGRVSVVRGGKKTEVDSTDLVVGDVIYLRAGMSIPADCVVVEGSLKVNESALTGESTEIKKEGINTKGHHLLIDSESFPNTAKIFKGCICTNDECKAVVCKVGDETEYGKIAKELTVEDRKSPLKERLSELAKSVSYLGYVAAFMIMTAYLFNVIVIDSAWNTSVILLRLKDIRFLFSSIISAVTLGVSVIVVAVPEGLPMMITVVLSSNMKKMMRSGVLVRKMVGIETAGSMNILFTDKTGTLTTGNMTVKKVYTADKSFNSSYDISKDPVFKNLLPLVSEYLVGSSGKTATEKAVVNFCKGPKTDPQKIKCIEKLGFNSDNKYSGALYKRDGAIKCSVMGAAEKILSASDFYLNENGDIRKMNDKTFASLCEIIKSETSSCARVLAVAEADASCWNSICCNEPRNLIFTAFISIRDELRKDAALAVSETKNAGVQVVMITGDNRDTARSVAREAGILDNDHGVVITGDEMSGMSDDELSKILPSLAVVARALPSDKKRLVEISGKMGLVSGMTGDGINDAPSLKCADVGFAMGSGSDVAKEAGDIIITNNSFSSITRAILYGRCVFESIRKFITFQLTMNLCALGVSLIGPFIGIESPITVIQMLWVNIIMDTLGGLAFAGEIPLREYMMRPPIKRQEKILTGKMIFQILYLGVFTLALCIAFLKVPFIRENIAGDNDLYFLTCFFALFIFCGIFNSFNARAPRGKLLSHISGNKGFILIMLTVAIAQLAIIYLGGEIFRCTPLSLRDISICALLSLTVIPADQLRKKIFQ